MRRFHLLAWALLFGVISAEGATACYRGLDSLAPFACIESQCPSGFVCSLETQQCIVCPGADGGAGVCAAPDGGTPDGTIGVPDSFSGGGSFQVVTDCETAGANVTTCTCPEGQIAISGGASAGTLGDEKNLLSASVSGSAVGGSSQSWLVACVQSTGESTTCESAFAICASTQFAAIESPTTTSAGGDALDSTCAFGEAALSGGGSAGTGNMLNAMQIGATFGGGQVWRVSAVDPSGIRVTPDNTFVVCTSMKLAPSVESDSCTSSLEGTTCSCEDGEVAISGGAFAGTVGDMLSASVAGPVFGRSTSSWQVSCASPGGSPTECSDAFVVCARESGEKGDDGGTEDSGSGEDGGLHDGGFDEDTSTEDGSAEDAGADTTPFLGTWDDPSSTFTETCNGSSELASLPTVVVTADGDGTVLVSIDGCGLPASVSGNSATILSGAQCTLSGTTVTAQNGSFDISGASGTLSLTAVVSSGGGGAGCSLQGTVTYSLEDADAGGGG